MEVEKKTLIYILIGLIYISGCVTLQGGWSNIDRINYLLVGEYSTDSYPDLYVNDVSDRSSYGDHFNFVYSGYYIDKIHGLTDEDDKLYRGIILLETEDDYIRKKYNDISSDSQIKIVTAYNENNQNNSQCNSIKMKVKQDGEEIDSINVENTQKPEIFEIKPQETNFESIFTVRLNSDSECNNRYQSVGVDKFYLDESSVSN